MLDMRFIREHATEVKRGAQRKGFGQVDIDRLLQVDADLRQAKQGLQEIATKKNKAGEQISKLSGKEKQEAIEEISALKAQEKQYRERTIRRMWRFGGGANCRSLTLSRGIT